MALLVLALGGGTLWLLTSDDSGDDPPVAATDPTAETTSTSTSTSPDPTTTTVTSTSTTTSTSTSTTAPWVPETDEGRLGDLRGESLGRLVTDGRWAVVLTAKQDGTRDNRQVTSSGSHVFRLADILELHRIHEGTYASSADVYLLRAEDLESTQGANDDRIWMTVVDPGWLSSKSDAQQWCRDEYPWLSGDDLDNACYPRQLSSPR